MTEPFHSNRELYELVYQELRTLAHARMSREYIYSTLQGTALVHEAWIRLGAENQPQWKNKRHLFGAASEAMRRILIEKARKRKSEINGGGLKRAPEEHMLNVSTELKVDHQLLQIGEALETFAKQDPEKAELVRLRYFFGQTFEEAADTLGISLSTAKRWWTYSRAWLQREIMEE